MTAVGAVVAAGLTPGIVTGTPSTQPPASGVELTAADAVVINGETIDFDELYAQVVSDSRDPQVVFKTVYGPPPSRDKKKRRAEMSEQNRRDSVQQEKAQQEKAIQEAMRQDSILQAMDRRQHALVYGPPPPKYRGVGPAELRIIAANDKLEASDVVLEALMDYCGQMPLDPNVTGQVILSESRDLVSELMMGPTQLEMLQQEIADRFAVQLSEEMLKQLGTLRRVADFIAEVVAPIKEE